MSSKGPSSEWGLSPVKERWFVIRMVAFLTNELKQFGCYNVYKSDSTVDLELFNSDNNKIEKMLAKYVFVLRPVYGICNWPNMLLYWWNSTILRTSLPAVGGIHYMFKANPSPINYETLKYTKGYIGVRVAKVQHYKEIVEILDRNTHELQYLVQEIPPPWGIKL